MRSNGLLSGLEIDRLRHPRLHALPVLHGRTILRASNRPDGGVVETESRVAAKHIHIDHVARLRDQAVRMTDASMCCFMAMGGYTTCGLETSTGRSSRSSNLMTSPSWIVETDAGTGAGA